MDCENIIYTIDNLKEVAKSITTDTSYYSDYDKLINSNKIVNIHDILSVFNRHINNKIDIDKEVEDILTDIDRLRKDIKSRFDYKLTLCDEYIEHYKVTSDTVNNLMYNYTSNLLSMVKKIESYNKYSKRLIDDYKLKFEHYKNNNIKGCPKNYMIQLIVNMILLKNIRNTTNILHRKLIIKELEKQIGEFQEANKLDSKLELNEVIMKECYGVSSILKEINDLKEYYEK